MNLELEAQATTNLIAFHDGLIIKFSPRPACAGFVAPLL